MKVKFTIEQRFYRIPHALSLSPSPRNLLYAVFVFLDRARLLINQTLGN